MSLKYAKQINFVKYLFQDIFGRGMGREPRKPSGRLRWGRSDPSMNIVTDDSVNELDVQPEKRKPMRLRWGRSYNPQQVLAVQGDDEVIIY